MQESPFFKKTVLFKSTSPGWSSAYLKQPNQRLTALLKDDLGNAFWEHYSRVLIHFYETQSLLLRIKSVTPELVDLTQIWQSRASYENFLKEAMQGESLKHLLEKKGLSVFESDAPILASDVPALVFELRTRPHIVQFLHERWRLPGMSVGDPLKRGRNYLPFPNES
jgi:hypothetical protein